MSQSFIICISIWLGFGFSFPDTSSGNYTNTAATEASSSVAASLFTDTIAFHQDYNDDIQRAMDFLAQHPIAIQQFADQSPDFCRKTLAVIFPELIRYHRFRDFLETEALEQLYVRLGTSGADFSIGPFQMKPSFVEKLETYLQKDDCLAEEFAYLLLASEKSEKEKRQKRLQRLQELSWQLNYALAFVKIMEQITPSELSGNDRLRFMATAYNFGFDRPATDIRNWQLKAVFPYGAKYKIPQFSYAALSVFAYQFLLEDF